MKNLFLVILFLTSIFSTAQNIFVVKNDSDVYVSGNKTAPKEVRSLLEYNPKALALYNTGKTKKTVGNILIWSGIASTAIGTFSFNGNGSRAGKYYLYCFGGVALFSSIPVKMGYKKKIKDAITIVNDDLKNPKTGFNIESTNFIANANGVGISITF